MHRPATKSPVVWRSHSASEPQSTHTDTGPGLAPRRTGDFRRTSDHLGVTDDQISWIAAPAGDAFDDEPRQG
jgi:hypothetical protein